MSNDSTIMYNQGDNQAPIITKLHNWDNWAERERGGDREIEKEKKKRGCDRELERQSEECDVCDIIYNIEICWTLRGY